MDKQLFFKIAGRLQTHASLFRTFWDWSDINFTDSIPNAAVRFERESGLPVQIDINENWWLNLNFESQVFVIAHELLHILLNHGLRFPCPPHVIKKVNIAGDIVINHMLVDYLNFNYNILDASLREKGCWLSTVFPNRTDILSNQSTKYYYRLLPESYDGVEGFDIHSTEDSNIAKDIQDFLDSTGLTKQAETDQNLSKVLSKEAGFGEGGYIQLQKKHIPKKKKWETVIKRWESDYINHEDNLVERWDRTARRFDDIFSTRKDIKLPSEVNMFDRFVDKKRIDVFFFLDTSGSCYHLKDRFYTAAKSLDKKRFNVRLFAFDTKVTELSLDDFKIYGGGGTSFTIIEDKIQQIMRNENMKYPTIFLITDGWGTTVKPEKPERWIIFLTEGSTRSYLDKKSQVFYLKDFE